MKLLKRKIDKYLLDWKNNPQRKPLIVKGARQIGKTESVRAYGKVNYDSVIEINFVLQKKFRAIFDNGYEVDTIIKNISLLEPSWEFIPHKTLIFFDELQKCPDCATSLKSFCQDGRYDVICSSSLMGIYYEEIESNAVGFKNKDFYSLVFQNLKQIGCQLFEHHDLAIMRFFLCRLDITKINKKITLVLGNEIISLAVEKSGKIADIYFISQKNGLTGIIYISF